MKKTILLFLTTTIILMSCKNNDCDKLCFTSPEPFQFELVDATTGENLFTNKTYESRYIKVINIEDENRVDFNFISENNYNILVLQDLGWQTEIVNYSIQINDKELFTLYVDAERNSEDCCSFTRYNEIKIENSNYTFDKGKGLYTILIE